MPLTFADLQDHAEHAAGYRPDSRTEPGATVNQAGRYLASMHEWAFYERPPYRLDFKSNQDYVDLPADFHQMIDVVPTSTVEIDVKLTDLAEVRYLRSSPLETLLVYYVALEYPGQNTREQYAAPGRLAIYPTPDTDQTSAAFLIYRAGWLELSDPQHVPNIPPDMEPLLVQLVRTFALGYSEDHKAQMSERLHDLESSTMINRLKQRWGMSTSSLGQMRGGAVMEEGNFVFRPFRRIYAGGQSP